MSLRLQVECSRTQPGEAVFVTGNHHLLGNWDPKRALKLSTTKASFPLWSSDTLILPDGFAIEFKFLVQREDGVGEAVWEGLRHNRKLTIAPWKQLRTKWGSRSNDGGSQSVGGGKRGSPDSEQVKPLNCYNSSQVKGTFLRLDFPVAEHQLNAGIRVVACGEAQALGAWNPFVAPALELAGCNWVLSRVDASIAAGTLFKYVVLENGRPPRWEDSRANRQWPEGGKALPILHYFDRADSIRAAAASAADSARDKQRSYGKDSGSSMRHKGVQAARSSHQNSHDLEKNMQFRGPDACASARPVGGDLLPCTSPNHHYLLSKEHVVQKQLSDHMPQIFICGGARQRIRVLTWNIMIQCRNTRFTNNGFGKNETGREYLKRLRSIAIEVARFFTDDDSGLPMVAALQECPCGSALKEEFHALMNGIEQVLPNIGWRAMQTSGSIANVTLWHRSQWRCEQREQQVHPQDGSRALNTKLALVHASVPRAEPCTIVNVHLEWKANPKDDSYHEHVAHVAEAVRRFMEEPGLVVVAGDFNMNVLDTHTILAKYCKDVVVQQIHASSQVWKDGLYLPNTVDGVIWKSLAK